MKRVEAIVVNYHQPKLAAEAACSVLASRGVDANVIVIENEGDGAWVREVFGGDDRVTLIANAENIGFGPACNQGIECARRHGADFVFLINSDAVVQPDTIEKLIGPAEQHGMAAPKILLADGKIYSAGGIVEVARARCRNRGIYEADRGQYDRPETMSFASGCALLISRKAIDTGARFYEPYFLYYEDADLCLHLGKAGFAVAYEPSAVAIHMESASTTAERKPHLDYYDARNRWVFLSRNGSAGERIVGGFYLMAIICIKIIKFIANNQSGRAHAIWRGMMDGFRKTLGPMKTSR